MTVSNTFVLCLAIKTSRMWVNVFMMADRFVLQGRARDPRVWITQVGPGTHSWVLLWYFYVLVLFWPVAVSKWKYICWLFTPRGLSSLPTISSQMSLPEDGTNCFHLLVRRSTSFSLSSSRSSSSNRPLNFIKAPDCLRHMAASGLFSSPGLFLTGCALRSCHGSVKLYLCVLPHPVEERGGVRCGI